jgi:hypothetical protein
MVVIWQQFATFLVSAWLPPWPLSAQNSHPSHFPAKNIFFKKLKVE